MTQSLHRPFLNLTKKLLFSFFLILSIVLTQAGEPLRVFIRAGVKTHGPNQHDHPRFLKEWSKLLAERGIQIDGVLEFPTSSSSMPRTE